MFGRKPFCAECAATGHEFIAGYTCTDTSCDLKPLCSAHISLHKQWGHVVTVLIPECDTVSTASATVVAPDAVVGVTYCSKPEHAGAAGFLKLFCEKCSSLLCRLCADDHLDLGHKVITAAKAAISASCDLETALPVLKTGVDYYTKLCSDIEAAKTTLDINRADVVSKLAASAVRLHQQVDAQHSDLLCRLQKLYDTKAGLLCALTSSVRCAVGELETSIRVSDIALAARPDSVTRVHVARTIAATLPLATSKPGVGVSVTLCGTKRADLPPTCFEYVGDSQETREEAVLSRVCVSFGFFF